MSSFFERNKKKSILAALLLFLKRGKGVVALLLLISALTGTFVLPTGMRVPWASRPVDPAGLLGGGAGEGARFSDMASAMRLARDSRTSGSLFNRFMGGRGGGSRNPDQSSTEWVKGKPGEEIGGSSAGQGGYDEKVRGGRSISGVMRPEDAEKMEEGLNLSEEEFQAGMVKSAEAGVFAGGGGAGGPSAAAARAGLSRGGAISGGDGFVQKALESTKVPGVGSTVDTKKAAGGKLAALQRYGVGTKLSNAFQRDLGRGSNFYKLAEARAYSTTSAVPNCEDPFCPREYAATTAGMVFEGSRPGNSIMASPEIGETEVTDVPGSGQVQTLIDEAERYNRDAMKCEEAERRYGPEERRLMKQLDEGSGQLKNAGCNSGGCSKAKAQQCKQIGDRMRSTCNRLNQVFQDKSNACPLSNGRYDQHDCNQ